MKKFSLILMLALCLNGMSWGQGKPLSSYDIQKTATYEPVVQTGKNVRFKKYFRDQTLRLDYLRRGNYAGDTLIISHKPTNFFSLWAGRRGKNAIDPVEGGRYRVVMADHKSHRVLYTFSYNTLFSEYRDLPEAHAGKVGSFEEVLLLPYPRETVDIFLQQRDNKLVFRTQLALSFTPGMPLSIENRNTDLAAPLSPETERLQNACLSTDNKGNDGNIVARRLPDMKMHRTKVRALHHSGDPRKCMDIVIVPEGYGPRDSVKMERDMERFAQYAIGKGSFQQHADVINVWGVEALGAESGITDPTKGITANSAVGSSYGTFGSDRYLMTQKVFKLYDLLQGVPFDHIVIMANSETYGGGGIYNYYTMSAVQEMSEWILPHELGHSIGGLADEYVDSDTNFSDMHPRDVEPVEPNITTLVNFGAKWKAMVPAGTPIPTPPPAAKLPKDQCGPLGAYEGAGYVAKGVYRPTPHCMMKDYHPFCPVCTKQLEKVIKSFLP